MNNTFHSKIIGIPIRVFAVLVISAVVFDRWAYFVIGQRSGMFFYLAYPDCVVGQPQWLGNGVCQSEGNIEECNFDDGDCVEFNRSFPDCKVNKLLQIGNGQCDGGEYNTAACDFDGGDCDEFNQVYPGCGVENPAWIGDGECSGREYNTE